jgi:hypothetical protein
MSSIIAKEIKKAVPNVLVEQKGKDIVVKSKDRTTSKNKIEAHFKKNKIIFKSVFKKAKSSSIDVLEVPGAGDIIFKPIIQKGAGGVKFEGELANDITAYLGGADYRMLKHPDVLKEMEKKLRFSRKVKYEIVPEGSKNQKRQLLFTGAAIKISNSNGKTLTDLTLKKDNKLLYLSLKMSSSYYTLSAGIVKYFMEGGTKIKINEYFGFNGQKMAGFGKPFACVTKKPNYEKVRRNLEDLLAQSVGTDVILIHKKKDNDVMVSEVGKTNRVAISNLSDASYVYPEKGVRKYANIKVSAVINGHKYIVNFQFRGTTAADVGPKYLRILLERL